MDEKKNKQTVEFKEASEQGKERRKIKTMRGKKGREHGFRV